ncbi:MAG TPA: serine protease [Burkholderiales bacterium]|jgi:hypothetical protein|nr:serine protease [Burkholderiales bacterium]
MTKLTWQKAVETIRPHIVRISTPNASGTGFLFAYAQNRSVCGIATAAHVIGHAHAWEQPIRIQHHETSKTVMLYHDNRSIFIDENLDTAALVVATGDLAFPETPIGLTPVGKSLKVGVEVGWLGFPAVAPDALCFFSGRVSAWLKKDQSYLVDGVAINGVSGGPTFHCEGDGSIVVIGVVSAYIPNRATGIVLPGLSEVRHVRQLRDIVKNLKSIEEAMEKQTPPKQASGEEATPPADAQPAAAADGPRPRGPARA